MRNKNTDARQHDTHQVAVSANSTNHRVASDDGEASPEMVLIGFGGAGGLIVLLFMLEESPKVFLLETLALLLVRLRRVGPGPLVSALFSLEGLSETP
jgi:hypothetical protein